MREVDDKIIYALNSSVPTESFKGLVDGTSKCKDLHNQLQISYRQRDTAIRDCILLSANEVKRLKEERESNTNDIALNKLFKSEQRKVSLKLSSIILYY